jgi:ABC-type Mn2+/Zn2+ transport system permease subunit/Mn-dependent DtxR family transcriptional regulator
MTSSPAEAAELITWIERVQEVFLYYPWQLAASAVIGATLGLLGCFVVLRRMALIGDALSHSILPGVVAAFLVINYTIGDITGFWGVWGLFAGALFAGLITALGIGWVSKSSRAKEDSAVGIVFTAMFALGVIMISLQPKGTHFDLKDFLFGSPLAIQAQDMISIAIVAPAVCCFLLLTYRSLKLLSFDPQIAQAMGMRVNLLHYFFMAFLSAAVVAALRTVGVIMSVAMLITPAATAYQLTNRLWIMLLLSGLFGTLSATLGFLFAFALNIPTGPAMVIVSSVLFLAALLFSPEYGLVGKAMRRRAARAHIAEEDILVSLARTGGAMPREELDRHLGKGKSELERTLKRLLREKQIERTGDLFQASASGLSRGLDLLRSHHLWESYLAEKKIPGHLLHDAAMRLEHAHELADEIAEELGHPELDPHGVPIPKKQT